jgi:hypothetical protein
MIFRSFEKLSCTCCAAIFGGMVLAACNATNAGSPCRTIFADRLPVQVDPVFPEAEPLAHRHRNHSMTEAPDGRLRVFAAQQGDITELKLMTCLADGSWSEPTVLDLPRRETNTSPRFFPDGTLYYSSDAPHPNRPGRKDLNIWRVNYTDDEFGQPEVMPDSLNTGSHEDGFTPLGGRGDRAVFSSTTLGGVGGYDLYVGEKSGDDWRVVPFPYNTAMADSHPVVTPDGEHLFWYAHLPSEDVYGAVDLFVSRLDSDGWSAPVNLGPVINTAGIEYGAGVSADGDTFFFSRDGVLFQAPIKPVIAEAGYVAPAN